MNRMKTRLTIGVCALAALLAFVGPAAAYTVDGDLTDWGLAALNSGDWSVNETWLPNAGIQFIVEDNYDPTHGLSSSYPTGVHIKGTGSSYSAYIEDKQILERSGEEVSEPFGGEYYDLEAMYFDQDDEYIYLAIVTSLDPEVTGGDKRAGDLALNLNKSIGDLGYEYGVSISPRYVTTRGDIVFMPEWEKIGYLLPVKPDVILPGTGSIVGRADVVYTDDWLNTWDNDYPNYVIEMAIPKSVLGVEGETVSFGSIMYADNCINEHIQYVPEFPTIAISLGAVIGMIFAIFVVRKKEE